MVVADGSSTGLRLAEIKAYYSSPRSHASLRGANDGAATPSMLRLIAYSAGSVDYVYHLALPELRAAAAELETERGAGIWKPRADLERMVAQGRVRDYDDLVSEVSSLPPGPSRGSNRPPP
jgi:hypothetical protein